MTNRSVVHLLRVSSLWPGARSDFGKSVLYTDVFCGSVVNAATRGETRDKKACKKDISNVQKSKTPWRTSGHLETCS
jgi:hypothetical protein